MYSNLHFAITILGIFSIFEILKGGQKLSVLKYHILARLLMIAVVSFFDYLELAGYKIPYYHEIFKLIAAVLFVNMLFLIVRKKIPKIVIGLEVFFTLYFVIQFKYGFQILIIGAQTKILVIIRKPGLIISQALAVMD